jgi:hypothetical protein
MKLKRLILMFEGRVEYDFYTKMKKPRLNEKISIEKEKECLHYDVKFIQHFFNEQGEFQFIMITGVRKL